MTAYPITAASERTDLTVRALARRTDDYKRDAIFESLVTSYVDRLRDIEAATWEVVLERLLQNAIGVQLDILGKIVGEPRFSIDDDEYRLGVRCRIAVNLSQGLMSDIRLIASMILWNGGKAADVNIYEYWPGTVMLDCLEVIDGDINHIALYLQQTRSAGIRLQVIYPLVDIDGCFTFSDNDVSEDADTGWGDAS
jgi:hypothetical protein